MDWHGVAGGALCDEQTEIGPMRSLQSVHDDDPYDKAATIVSGQLGKGPVNRGARWLTCHGDCRQICARCFDVDTSEYGNGLYVE